jgi:tRNA pseudouridine55 synthase
MYAASAESWRQPYLEGQVLLMDKPLTWTSFDVVKKVRIQTGVSKVGHAGTLDPLATGLLIVCTGKFTKRINEYMAREKEYTGTFRLGSVTPTYDLESEPVEQGPYAHISLTDLGEAAKSFTGDIMQVPPAHSAVKKDGKPAYLLARKGREVRLDPRPITIREFEITSLGLPEVGFRIVCTTGTYIRSLAHDMGRRLGCGAHLSSLRRTRIGEFSVDDATGVESFVERVAREKSASGQNG